MTQLKMHHEMEQRERREAKAAKRATKREESATRRAARRAARRDGQADDGVVGDEADTTDPLTRSLGCE